ncbi:MAG: hypothetical protein HUJ25_15330 [Crocinitomicaceae bacterium]|nr:hypothetical protein [Crocinitomicaceae bacterium]
MKPLFLSLLTFCTVLSFAQVEVDSATTAKLQATQMGNMYRGAVSFNAGGVTGIFGVTYDYFITNHWRLESGIGYAGFGFGFDYFPWKIERQTMRFRINLRNSVQLATFWKGINHYLGFGFTHFAVQRINFGIDAGISYIHSYSSFTPYYYSYGTNTTLPFTIFGNIKLGYRFSFRVMKRKKQLERGMTSE